MKKQKNVLEIAVLCLIVCAVIAAIIFPFTIAHYVYDVNIFSWIPGKDDVWMGFWASYSGTIATLIVAVCTWLNSRSISELQVKYYQLNAGVNLRLVKVSIVPIVESGNLNKYKVILYFHNVAKSIIEEIKPCVFNKLNSKRGFDKPTLKIKVGEKEELCDINNPSFGLQDDNEILQFEIRIEDIEVKKDFVQSYFYYSQFPTKRNDINLEIGIQVRIDTQSKDDDWMKQLHIELFPEPVFDKINTFFDMSDSTVYMDPLKQHIKCYKWKEIE